MSRSLLQAAIQKAGGVKQLASRLPGRYGVGVTARVVHYWLNGRRMDTATLAWLRRYTSR